MKPYQNSRNVIVLELHFQLKKYQEAHAITGFLKYGERRNKV